MGHFEGQWALGTITIKVLGASRKIIEEIKPKIIVYLV